MKDKETIEKIKENLKDASFRFASANNPQVFKAVAEEYLEDLCTVYDINDIHLNNDAMQSYREVCGVLEKKLLVKSLENLEKIWHFTMVLKAFMDRFYVQAGHQYD